MQLKKGEVFLSLGSIITYHSAEHSTDGNGEEIDFKGTVAFYVE